MTIEPDTKDWTWVLRRPCPDCGLDCSAIGAADVPDMIRDNAARWREVLTRPDVRERPVPSVWSPLEYACHVRDVFLLFDQRLAMMLTDDGPRFPNWNQDVTAVEQDYGSQDPERVSAELATAAATVADRFASVGGDQWQRTGFRSDGALFTIDSFARYFIHDPVHHLHDVGA